MWPGNEFLGDVGAAANNAFLLASSVALSPADFLGGARAPHPPPNLGRENVDGVVLVSSSSLAAAVAWPDCDFRATEWKSRRVRPQVLVETMSTV